ncbi:hypothetical protein GHT06_011086 [Daphnia sinensis]|uniref:Uncharacterized protein n=1 Tax=Daphnia sinensis TaxID=1820382 RepID=A0AAD5L022_9CRUS|nr:hypothetical protein GHT06_011086 [Daphnia sinensis]
MSAVRRVSTLTLFLLFALLAVEVPARVLDQAEQLVINPSEISAIVEPMVLQARERSTVTVTALKTTTISSVLMTTITTKKTCGYLAYRLCQRNTPCSRRKRQYWDRPVFVALKEDDNPSLQYFRLNPSQVLSFEPTMLPQFRNNHNPSIALLKESTSAIAPSFGKSSENVRVAKPVFGGGINSLISSIVSASTLYTSTTSFFVVGACYPAGLTIC